MFDVILKDKETGKLYVKVTEIEQYCCTGCAFDNDGKRCCAVPTDHDCLGTIYAEHKIV